jgi:hypothetical protein
VCPHESALLPDLNWLDTHVKPQDHEVVEEVGAFAHDAICVSFDGFDGDFAGLLDYLAGSLAATGLQ